MAFRWMRAVALGAVVGAGGLALAACESEPVVTGEEDELRSCNRATTDEHGICRAPNGQFAPTRCCNCEGATIDLNGYCRNKQTGRFAPAACCEALCEGAVLDGGGYCRLPNGRFALNACCIDECIEAGKAGADIESFHGCDGRSQPEPPCGGVTVAGQCDGDTLSFCLDGELSVIDCTVLGGECGLNNEHQWSACLPACTEAGFCNLHTLVRCDANGERTETDCQEEGQTCDASAPGGPSCVTYEPCGDLGPVGECEGDTLRYCDTGKDRVVSVDCASGCAFFETTGLYDCN